MAVPLLDLNAQNLPLLDELNGAFARVVKSGHFILGREVEALESELAAFIGAKHALTVSSGTDALLLALMALDIQPGDEIICPAYTFFATAGCVSRLGAIPVFADVRADTFNLDPEDFRRKITPRTRGVIPVHLFGQCAEMESILAIAREFGIHVIEDAAQALGARYRGQQAGTMGDFGTYSFFPSKNLGGFGDGGLLATNDDALAERAMILRVHGSKPKYFHKFVGGNFRMDALQCALLRVKLPHYQKYTEGRRANAAYYQEAFRTLGLFQEKGVLPSIAAGCEHIWNQYTMRIPGPGRRDALRRHLAEKQIGSEIYYPVPLHQQECFASLPTCRIKQPVSEQLATEALSIPIFPELRRDQLEEVVAAFQNFPFA